MNEPLIIGLTLSPTFANGLNIATDVLRASYPEASDAELLERIFVTGICQTVDHAQRQRKIQLRIISCADPQMWYANLIGLTVPYLGRWPEAYKSREPGGYINRVEFSDAHIEIA